jgi:hypothetical protein
MLIYNPSDILNLTAMFRDGELVWSPPAGVWQVVRFVCSNNGQQLIAASPNSKGLFIDFLDPEATRFHFEYIINKLGIPKGGSAGSSLKSLDDDSMELHEGIPRGEFWLGNPRNLFLDKEIASAAHIYGKPYVDAESWTTWRRWRDGPFTLKKLVDRAFCEGLNRITYHGFSNSPVEFGYPGRSYHAGLDMNPQITWWSKARPFMEYTGKELAELNVRLNKGWNT